MPQKKYQVILTREASESTTVTVEADSKEAANEKALEMADQVPDWSLDDGNYHRPYLPDPNSTEEVEDEDAPSV